MEPIGPDPTDPPAPSPGDRPEAESAYWGLPQGAGGPGVEPVHGVGGPATAEPVEPGNPLAPTGPEAGAQAGRAAGREHPESIGPYRILRPLGEGGMGAVYLAEQRRPIARQVALKLIRRGMDTREIVARFESERQALALMTHPSIARVLDGGSTPEGLPYFVSV